MINPIVITLFVLFKSCLTSDTASFFGGSYITVPLEEAKSTTNIHFRLLTKNPDSILFLAAGKTDYCFIKLVSGRIRVHLNLGAGESTITSPVGLRLDDLTWHEVSFIRIDAFVNLTIDNIHVTREKLPGRFFELNIHYGLFIGGQGEFSELFLGHVNWFRGCISDLTYNGVNPLNRARHRLGLSEAHDVSWTCASEFYADYNKEISFVDIGSFMSLSNILSRIGTRWIFMLKTTSVDCLLMYTSGGGENADFVGAEIINGKVHVVLDKGGGPGDVISEVYVSDGTWHAVKIAFNSYSVELTVDNNTVVHKLIQTATKYYDLGDMVYIGGIEVSKRSRALGQGLKAADTSLKGCMKSIHLGATPVGFPQARISKGLLPGCVWSYPCQLHPCTPDATCAHRGVGSFICLCDTNDQTEDYCVREDFHNVYNVLSPTSQLEILEVNPIHLFEGQNSLITPSNINIILDYAKYGVRDTGVIFSTVAAYPPKYGRLVIEVNEKKDELQTFTLLDLAKDKVRYIHDGSESLDDEIYIDFELSPTSGFVLPGYLQGQHRFVLHANITAINDPPIFNSVNKTLTVPQATRVLLTSSILNATDVDSDRNNLVYTILSDGNGRLERLSHTGISVMKFTQDEVDNELLAYYHGGPPGIDAKLSFQVSDGLSSSQAIFVKVSVIPLKIELMNNTGAILPYNSFVILSSSNLTIVSNADDPLLQIIFKVVEPSQYGILEKVIKLNGKSVWQGTDEFSYSQLIQKSVRYRHINGHPDNDSFKFILASIEVEFPKLYEFKLAFIDLNVTETRCCTLHLMGTTVGIINEEVILYQTSPIPSSPEIIYFTVRKLPTFGNLFYLGKDVERLILGDIFTQNDINKHHLQYKMLRTGYVPITDSIDFDVSVENSLMKISSTLFVTYAPASNLPHSMSLSINTLKVMEGGISPISNTELSIHVPSVKSLVYEISSGPYHGSLILVDTLQNITENHVLRFTPSQISAGRLFYSHDGSETSHDNIQFFALSNIEDDFMTIGLLNVNVTLVNDNAPQRVVSNVFRIVKGGQRLLTTKHIKFEDKDIDFDPMDLVYTVKKGSGVFSSMGGTPLTQFTQEELETGKILIIESGHDKSPIYFTVSDGRHLTETSLDVRPSPPFVEITNNSHLIVAQSGQAKVTSANLFSDTNLDINLNDISYNVLAWPTHGELIISGLSNGSAFTQGDIESGSVAYKHLSASLSQDRIQFKVSVGNIYTIGSLAIRVFPHFYWEPLIIVSNETLIVEEFTSVVISGSYLQVKQQGVPSSDIMFLVISGSKHGYLDIEGSEEDRLTDYEEKGGVKTFDQSTINAGKLYYVETVANQTEDNIVIDITNGVTWLHSLRINFLIIPSTFYLQNEEVSVIEGGSTVLPVALFFTPTLYYRNKISEYYLHQEPAYGNIVISPSNKSVNKWSSQQIKGNSIKYIHDGSETIEDSFTIIAKAGRKESEPSKIVVKITPINDMTPVIVNKTCLKLWQGGSAILTSEYLAAVDDDTPPENVTFVIISASGGHIALASNKSSSIDKFSQKQINSKEVLVVHDGGEKNFILETVIVDGKNKYGPITFITEFEKPILKLNNLGLHMFPRLVKIISPANLNVSCSDSREIYYNIRKHPSYGKLILDGSDEIFSNFTQTDVNNLRLSYQHITSFKNTSLLDSFLFDVSADFIEPVRYNVFKINISVLFGGLDQVFESSYYSLSVEEGNFAPLQINTSGILDVLVENIGIPHPLLRGVLSTFPNHGLLCIQEDCNITMFSEKQLQSGYIIYQHDHSDSMSDFIQISLYLEPNDVLLNNISFVVKILPVNDQPFKLFTKYPHINVVHGQEAIIPRNALFTEDSDTDSSNIVYEIIDGPDFGNLYLSNSSTYKFTQHDINSNKIKYKHFGPVKPTHFNFKVSDGQFDPEYATFNITVSEIELNINVKKPVLIQQGANCTSISSDILEIITNAKVEQINFNISTVPKFGLIYVRGTPSHTFEFPQMHSRNVIYCQVDMSASNDSFKVQAFNILNHKIVVPIFINITVVPLLKIGQFFPVSGIKNKLDLSVLDASPLAIATNSNPVYKIVKRPKHGRLKKIIRTTGEHKILREKEITKFTHKEVQSNVIYYVAKKTLESLDDRFTFFLVSSPYQPAFGEVVFKIEGDSPSTTLVPPKIRIPGSKIIAEQDSVQIASPNMSDDYLLGLSMVTGTIALALLIVGFVSCGSKQTNYESSLKSDIPESLPRPPDDLNSSPPAGVRNPPNNSSTLLPRKIANNSLSSSELELNLRYPYGDEDWNTFGNAENCSEKSKHNPLLRKNQYWV